VGHTAWHWMLERFDVLRQFPWQAPTLADVASGLRWVTILVAIGAAAWLAVVLTQRSGKPATSKAPERGSP